MTSGRPEVMIEMQPCGDWLGTCMDPPCQVDIPPALSESDAREMFTQLCEWKRDNREAEGYG